MSIPPGRKPKPTIVKLVTKTARPSRLNPKEPRISGGMPTPPAFLGKLARAEWRRLCKPLYAAGILTVADRSVFAAYCVLVERWHLAEVALAEDAQSPDSRHYGLLKTVARSEGAGLYHNPLVQAANRAMRDMLKFAAEMGLSPSSRSRIEVNPPAPEDDPGAKYFER